ncbi:hypothetical protein SCLCIDRAFT_1223732 [Scleroderma citrinum Foug A]|uniref:Uncharacterized protein n=1 Tax=Scleroderma citrinum Foug A TaxID=1036808 RepID=A0A0C3D8J4_9AGAM|nr:hypothetical protein SCLCIDRAFT_1223732 [Scleroderma citrinum Foug A]
MGRLLALSPAIFRSYPPTLTTPCAPEASQAIQSFHSSGTPIYSPTHLVSHLIVMSPVAISTVATPCSVLFPRESWFVQSKPIRKTRLSCTKYIERQAIRAWKRMTGAAHRHQRASMMPNGFILVTSRRRSVMFA